MLSIFGSVPGGYSASFNRISYIGGVKPMPTDLSIVFPPSELAINPDGSVYHLALKPEHLADNAIVVGDPGRVRMISQRFDKVELEISNREFTTHTGIIAGKRLTVLSTGIGVDNIDIVMNELDALRNIDLKTRKPKEKTNPLNIIRLGTSGSLNADLEVGSFVRSDYAIGLDGVMHYYQVEFEEDEKDLARKFADHVEWPISGISPYAIRGNKESGGIFTERFFGGITATACGFYGPQGRRLRLNPAFAALNERLKNFSFRGIPMANYEMESSALFGLGSALGHRCTTVCVIVANRIRNEFADDHLRDVNRLIETVLERVTASR